VEVFLRWLRQGLSLTTEFLPLNDQQTARLQRHYLILEAEE